MNDIIIVAIIAGSFQFITWGLQKLIDRKKLKIDNKETLSKIDNLEADTIQKLRISMDEIVNNYGDLNSKFIDATNELTRVSLESQENKNEVIILKSQMGIMHLENIELRKKNIKFENDITELQKENLIQKDGINKLIQQIKDVPLSPVWEPPYNCR